MTMSGKGDNSTGETENYESANMCLELALEGERLCKSGDCRAGVAFFQAAIRSGTDDLRTLSAIYSQLGNAYFYLGDYVKAMQFHKHDLTLARTMGDKLGEAKSSGNLGNTLKVMGKFDEAVICCKRHLEISKELNDKLSEGRALYNLGNVFHAKGKHIGRIGQQDPGEFPEDVRHCLNQAVHYYKENLKLMEELGDSAAQGRACGNLGNTYYLLGDFQEAISYHEKRLKIAREFGDKAAERRAYSNLGNCHIFLGQFEAAANHYKKTLTLGGELGDRAVEAQACYSLGNTYTLLRQYPTAIDFHERHLAIAESLGDSVGQARACWSLGNAHSAMGQHDKALQYSVKHLQLSKEVGDTLGMATAQMNISDLRKALGMTGSETTSPNDSVSPSCAAGALTPPRPADMSPPHHRVRRDSMSRMDIFQLTPDMKSRDGGSPLPLPRTPIHAEQQLEDDDQFFDLLSRFQSERMEDQRCSLSVSTEDKENQQANLINNGEQGQEELLELIVGIQSKRMDEQRVSLPALPGLARPDVSTDPPEPSTNRLGPDDAFLEMLMRCQSERLEDQRSELPDPVPGFTVPDEDFFSLIMRLQSGRMEDQRAAVPPKEESN